MSRNAGNNVLQELTKAQLIDIVKIMNIEDGLKSNSTKAVVADYIVNNTIGTRLKSAVFATKR